MGSEMCIRDSIAFVSAGYWGLIGTFAVPKADGEAPFEAALLSLDGTRVATGKDFDAAGELTPKKRVVLDEAAGRGLAAELGEADFSVASVEAKPYTRRPYPPFRTATLQQEAGRKLRFGARRAMSAAQKLYEGGYITYMRTDSITLSRAAINSARNLVAARYGAEYLPDKPRVYSGKVKNAQEAHEAIRPAGEPFQDAKVVARSFGAKSDEARIYDLIWKRAVASQMADARLRLVTAWIDAGTGRDVATFKATGRTIVFAGLFRSHVECLDDP